MQLLDFLSRMELRVDFRPATEKEFDKVVYLTNWTADFHLTAHALDRTELEELIDHQSHECWVIEASDRFGEYGVAGVMLFVKNEDVLDVHSYIISCKILGKNIEIIVLQRLAGLAERLGCRFIHLHYRKTPRNAMSADFVRRVGANWIVPEEGGFGTVLPVQELVTALSVEGEETTRAVGWPRRSIDLTKAFALGRKRTNLTDLWIDIRENYRTSTQIMEGIRSSKQQASAHHHSAYTAPRTPNEETLVSIWEDVLLTKPIGITNHFLELGGNSLLATQLLSRIRESFGVELPIRAIFEYPTIETLVEFIAVSLADESLEAGHDFVIYDKRDDFPLSYAQQRLWFLDQLEPGSPYYNMTLSIRLSGLLSVDALQHSIQSIVARHDILRTTFHLVDGQAVTRIAPIGAFPLQMRKLTGNEAQKQKEVQSIILTASRHPFDLSTGPLFQAILLQLAVDEHLLLITMHHIVSDGWSLGVLQHELQQFYIAYITNEKPNLTELSVQYADFVHWQRAWLQGARGDSQLEYWRHKLADIPPLLLLPTDRPRPAVQTFDGATSRQVFPVQLARELDALCKREGVTLYMLLLTAFQVLLHRYTGQETIVVGSPVANRQRTEIEGLIGFFVNTLALRADFTDNASFRDLLQQMRLTTLEAYSNQDLPFEQLVEALNPERSLATTPIFQVTFALHNLPATTREVADVRMEFQELSNGTSKFDLSMAVEESEQGLHVVVDYNTDLFNPDTIARMQEHYRTLLQAAVQNCSQYIADLVLLTRSEQQQFVYEWNDTDVPYATAQCVHELVAERAEQMPERIAVTCGSEQITYEELNKRANSLAHYLLEQGIDNQSVVGIYAIRSIDLVLAQLAVLKTGAAYMPIDPAYPRERVAYMLQDANVTVLLTKERYLEHIPTEPIQSIICLDRNNSPYEGRYTDNPDIVSIPSDLAYVIYTSGSTGQPKGVEIEHNSLLNLVFWHRRAYGVTPDDRATLLAGTAFDASVWELWPYLTAGASLHVVDEEVRMDAARLCDWMACNGITHSFVPTPLAETLIMEQWPQSAPLRYMLTGGDRLRFAPSAELPFQLINHYGPTESTVVATSGIVPVGEEGPITIGRPIDNIRIYLLDSSMQPVPLGVRGELYIGGQGLARGYRGRPDLTEERFVPNPFRSGEKLYRTGDLCRYLPDGSIEFIGRVDHQVKIRGYRIELSEIESALSAHPNVRSCAVIVHEDREGTRRLVGYVVNDLQLDQQQLKEYVKAILPAYMVPTAFVQMNELPLTPNGKVNHKALPAPDYSMSGDSERDVPRTEAEASLLNIWKQVLGIEKIGIHDNFFVLGGDSILSIQIVSRANRAGVPITTKHMFHHQTIAELAASAAVGTVVVAEQGKVAGIVPLMPIQRWLFEQELEELDQWNMAMLLSLKKSVDSKLLEQAFVYLLEHHDALRMRYFQTEEGWQQVNEEDVPPVLVEVVDLSLLPSEEQEVAIQQHAEQAQRSLLLAAGKLYQAVLFRLGEEGEKLLIVVHHLVIDGVSWRILLEDLETVYGQLVAGDKVMLPAKTTSFRDWAMSVESYVCSGQLASEKEYWLSVIDVQPEETALSVTVDRPHSVMGVNTVASIGKVTVTLDTEQTRLMLQEVPRAYRTQINDILLAALTRAVTDWTGGSSLYVALEGHGREDLIDNVEISRTVGWFTSLYPVRLDWDVDSSLGSQLQVVKEQLRRIPKRGIRYGLLRYLSDDPDMSWTETDHPEPQISFNYLGQFDQLLDHSSLFSLSKGEVGNVRSPLGRRRYAIDVHGMVFDGRLEMTWEYSRALHDAAAIERVANSFIAALEEYIAHCVSPEAGGYTPSDFPASSLIQQELDQIRLDYKEMEDVHLLSPLQQGMLFHSLYSPESTVYFEQAVTELTGPLDVQAFERAWQSIIQRHTIFRTIFKWKGLQETHQIVLASVNVPIQVVNLLDLEAEEQQRRIEQLLEKDRQEQFDLSQQPLMRLMLIRLEHERTQFVWSFHHILLDGWSVYAVLHELFDIYSKLLNHELLHQDTAVPYRNYIAWCAAQNLNEAKHYWRSYLQGFSAPTSLHIGGATRLTEEIFEQQQLLLTKSTTEELHRIARKQRVTVNTFVQAAWAVLLHRYSGEEDVVFGATVSVRPPELPHIESMIGLFINSLPVRMHVKQGAEVSTWIQELQERQADWMQFAHTPLSLVMECSEVPNGQPLFESLLVFENYPVNRSDLTAKTGLSVGDISVLERTTYPLTIIVVLGERLEFRSIYDRRRFDEQAIERLLGHLQVIVTGMVQAGEQVTMQALPLLTEAEQTLLLTQFDAGAQKAVPANTTIHHLIELQVRRTPDATALVVDEQRISYRELDRRANKLANHLRQLGVGPEFLVGICTERNADMVTGLLAILKAGGAYVPLDPAYPKDRLGFILEDTEVQVLLTQSQLADRLPQCAAHMIWLDTDWPAIERQSDQPIESGVSERNLAYIIYTSGSTGRPKGVALEHRNTVTFLKWCRENFTSDELAGVLASTSISFDLSVFELFLPLTCGGKVILAENALYLPELPAAHEVSLINTVPSAMAELIRMNGVPASVITVNLAGEQLPLTLARQVYGVGSIQRLYNLYGPSEDTTYSTYWLVEADAEFAPPIGYPIAATSCYILDAHLRPVPIGVPGELFIAGQGLARCYLHRPELTAEKFIENPFAEQAGERMYRTGDLCRYRSDGVIEYLGRMDHQVKIRGFRIELQEVETVLSLHTAVREAVVMVQENHLGSKQLVAYFVPELSHAAAPTTDLLRMHLKEFLPDYMIPSAFVLMDSFPLTPSGKVDRKALPLPDRVAESSDNYAEPRNEVESMLCGIWQQVLGVEQVGIHDGFFSLGGDSILSIQIISRASQAGLKLTPKQLFRYQTIAELAGVAQVTTVQVEQDQSEVTGAVALTPIQHWFFESDLPDWSHWHQIVHLSVARPMDQVLLTQAVAELLRYHDGLRLRFVQTESGWKQESVLYDGAAPVSEVDLSRYTEEEQADVRTASVVEWQSCLHITDGPLIRFIYFRTGDVNSDRLTIIVHHLVSDGITLRLLLEDLQLLYAQLESGQRPELPLKQTSYQEWATRLTAYAKTEAASKERSYWLNPAHWAGSPLPVDHYLGENTHASLQNVSVKLTAEETRLLLQEVPSAYRTQVNDVLLTALIQSFAGWTGQHSLLIHMEGHGREDIVEGVNIARTAGWFTSLYPVFLELEAAADLGTALKMVKEQLRSIPNRGVGFGILRYLSGDPEMRVESWSQPEAEVIFNYLGQFDQLIAGSTFFDKVELKQSISGNRRHVLDVYGMVSDGELQMMWEYSEHLHKRTTIERLADESISALRNLITHCLSPGAGGVTPSDFPLANITQLELDRLYEGNCTIEDIYPLSPTQQGMLFHTLLSPGTGMYFENMNAVLEGNLDINAFQKAWQTLVNRHSILRTGFVWKEMNHPHQVVYEEVVMPYVQADWRELLQAEQEQRLQQFLADEKQQGFQLERAPLMRVAMFRIGLEHYRMVWSFHHLLLDGWSVSLLLSELFQLYRSYSQQQEELQLQPPRPYRDYMEWLHEQNLQQAELYWKQQLSGFQTPTPLVMERKQAASEPGYEELRLELTEEVTSNLFSLMKHKQVTMNTMIQGAWSLLLSRYSGESDVVFGATVSGRSANVPNIEAMVGLFINTLPVRVRLNQDDCLFDWLWQLQDEQAEQRLYEFTPLSLIQNCSEVPNGISLFDSILVFENYPVDAGSEATSDLRLQSVETSEQTNYALTLAVVPGASLSLRMLYSREQFDPLTIRRVLGHMQTLLEQIAQADEHVQLKELVLMSRAEQKQLLEDWNDTAHEYAAGPCVHERLERQAAKTPDAIAVVCGEQRLTYRELNRRANQLAHHLAKHGIGAEMPVGICMERSVELIIAVLGVLKSGGAYVPLDPHYPKERLRFIMDDTQVPVLLTVAGLLEQLPEHSAAALCLDSDWPRIAEESGEKLAVDVNTANLAYVIYTSGSTGQPKGVQVQHDSLLNLIQWHHGAYQVTEADRATLIAGTAFDASVWEIWPYLTAGAALYIADDEIRLSPEQLRDWLIESGITLAFLPTPLAERVISVDWPEETPLRALLTGGDKLHHHPEAQLPFALVNHYGPTENTVVATCGTVASGVQTEEAPTIGRPIANTRCYILDASGQPVPIGVPGELYIAGSSLARGYLNRPELTAERFVQDPFRADPQARMYRTGDLCRYRADGEIEYVGRMDDQVKIRGFRIELGEVETVISHHPDVEEASVITRQDESGQSRLVAYVVPAPGQAGAGDTALTDTLRQYVKDKLPDYMIPSAFVMMERLPLTPNGKIDRKALPEVDWSGESQAYVAPRNAAEEILCSIWAQVLGLEKVGIYDHFFELGGDSILSIQVVARAAQAGLRIQPKMLFDYPVIAQLSAVVGEEAFIVADQGEIVGEVPLTPIQCWFFNQDIHDRHHWNQAMMLELRRPIDTEVLSRALHLLVLHHDALRLRYEQGDEGWTQRIVPAAEVTVPLEFVDLSQYDKTEQQYEMEARATSAQAGMDLMKGAIIRAVQFELGGDQGRRLLLAVHHLAIDGVSWRILIEDLDTLCGQLSQEQVPSLPVKTTSYMSWAERLTAYAQTDALHKEQTYWLRMADSYAVPLPIDHENGLNTLSSVNEVTVQLSQKETQSLLKEVPTAYRSEITEILLTALLRAFANWTGERGLMVTLEGHGREALLEDTDLSRTVGWFTSMYPVYLQMNASGALRDQITAIKEQVANIPNRGIGYGLLRWLREDEELHEQLDAIPEAEVSFNYLGQFDQMTSPTGWLGAANESVGLVHGEGARQHLLDIVGVVTGGCLRLTWAYSSNYHRDDTIERLAEHYMQALREIIAGCKETGQEEYTPADFKRTKLNQKTLDTIMAQVNQHNRRSPK
ncbi:non-ribosomal peptide synthase/polyketide synthase [Paenibacillus sp. MER TA 81-3]|uniref:non-ribosomal peptide synthase/polyketide synthase n=1 Tax=Paenibacillus sp. MER TA 81-3 TaxID=2939573 RepID=UPI00203C0FAD|nr:non-ribosomal peptide synthase/polyketide synthase [Paenibacillus sp. MER TA 81-3]MCM3338074.1 non-ribosomal peptide synthase/polyketide synthase [Paenibacillus sp. MER TA 81-3]